MSSGSARESSDLPVALDAMGGDAGASVNVEGAVAAVRADGARVVLVGDEVVLASLIERFRARDLLDSGALSIRHASEVVEMDEKPAVAVRKKKNSSMRIACDLVYAGDACGALSAGNSGAMMAIALLVFGRIDGVLRPAIGALVPALTPNGLAILVDAGANTECSPEHLFQFGILGSTLMERAYRVSRPVVGVVSNGEEDSKGTDLTRTALALLRQSDVLLHNQGYAEGRDLTLGSCHVLVTDGFTGNVMLKASEGVFKFVTQVIKQTYAEGNFVEKMAGLASRSVFERVRAKLDPREYGAAPLLGLAAPAFIAHGSSDAYAIRCSIGIVRNHAKNDVTQHLAAAIARNAAVLAAAKIADPSSRLSETASSAG